MTPSQDSWFSCVFGFTGFEKPSFLMFLVEPRCLDVWISFPFLAWDLEIYPRTHMWFFNQLWCTGACACIFQIRIMHTKVTRSLSELRTFFREAPVCKKLIPKLVPIRPIFYHNMVVPWHDTMPSFMIFRRVLDLQEFQNQVSQCSRPTTRPRCLNFIPISCMGPRNSPEDTHVIFQPTLVHGSMCL